MDVIIWSLTLIVFQFIFLPFSVYLFKSLNFRGILLSKLIGILFISFSIWFFGSLHILAFSRFSLLILLAVAAILNGRLLQKNLTIRNFLFSHKRKIILTELVFFLPFLIWVILRMFNPHIDNFEKFMDFGFVTTILRSEYFPPQDLWFSGEHINYYYFGHLVSAVLIKLSGVSPTIGYNLMMATIVGLSCTATFTLGSTFASYLKKSFRAQVFVGIISTLFVNFAGTLFTFGFLFEERLEPFWFWRSIRLIPGAIHEFPQYSFAVSDLHAHMLNIPFVLLVLCSLMNIWYLPFLPKLNSIKKHIPHLVIHGWILGICFMTSAWDLPIYLGVSGLAFFFKRILNGKTVLHGMLGSLIEFVIVILGIIVSTLLFVVKFDFSISQGVHLVYSHTELIHYFTLWAPPLITIVFGFCFWFFSWKKEKLESTYVFLFLLAGWGVLMTLIPEIIYLKDIYGGDFYRGNTILKFYYQAFIILGVVSSVLICKIFLSRPKKIIRLLLLLPVAMWIACLIYPFQIIPAYYNQFTMNQGLDGALFIQMYHPEDYETINWLNENVNGQPIVLEAAGDSYSYDNRISVFTGLPTVQGWFVHEWLWRGGSEKPGKRANDVRSIYESGNLEEIQRLISEYNIEYLYIGNIERSKYPTLQESIFDRLGSVVFQSGNSKLYKIMRN